MKMILITGGAGFIGSHLCDSLIKKNKIICVDNLFTGDKDNVKYLIDNPNFKFIQHDIIEPLFLEEEKIDEIYNLACPASPIHYQFNAIRTIKANILGTINMLGLAKKHKAKILQASTSEIYGDPLQHPQKESYNGNVNCTGLRACYDEGKRCAETLMFDYHRQNKVDIKVVRIFNSILADEIVFVQDDYGVHIIKIEDYFEHFKKNKPKSVFVPSFNSHNQIEVRKVSDIIRVPCKKICYELKLAYGRTVKVTEDHSVFIRDKIGQPIAKHVKEIKKGDYVAIPSHIDVLVKDVTHFDILKFLLNKPKFYWTYIVYSKLLSKEIISRRHKIIRILEKSGRFKSRDIHNSAVCAYNKYKRLSALPLFVIKELGIKLLKDGQIRVFKGGSHVYTSLKVEVDVDLMWLLGFYLAEGCSYRKGKSDFLSFASDDTFLKKAAGILNRKFGIHIVYSKKTSNKSPAIFCHSKLLTLIFDQIFNITRRNHQLRIPSWIFSLPKNKLKYFLEGFKDGDGTHSGKKLNNELCFDTKYKSLAIDLNYLLLRFGVCASFGKYYTTFKKKYKNKKFNFYRLTLCSLSNFNVLSWDKGVFQKRIATSTKDIIWGGVKSVKKIKKTRYVYDFSVPSNENFVAGNGVFCHNTYGPRMAKNDGRVVSNFITQALEGKDITVYGDGKQTRSFCYVSDLIDGMVKMMNNEGFIGPVNLGNPKEFTILELAKKVIELSGSKSKTMFKELPKDDPKQRMPDISLAKKKLLWEPKVELEGGLRKTIDYFKELNKK